VHLSKHILDYWKKQAGTLRISENINFTNGDVMNYFIGGLQLKLPRAPLPFNPALPALYVRTAFTRYCCDRRVLFLCVLGAYAIGARGSATKTSLQTKHHP